MHSSKYRAGEKKIALEGPNLVYTAVSAGYIPEVLFITESLNQNEYQALMDKLPQGVKTIILEESFFKKHLADTITPQYIAAIIPYDISQSTSEETITGDLVLVVDRLQDPGNMGSLIRTASAVGADRVYYTKGSADAYSAKVLRSTAGSIFQTKIALCMNNKELINQLKNNSFKLIAAAPKAETSYWTANYTGRIAIVIGNEASGISKEFMEAADVCVTIPLRNKVESLNASVSGAIILYEALRQRHEASIAP